MLPELVVTLCSVTLGGEGLDGQGVSVSLVACVVRLCHDRDAVFIKTGLQPVEEHEERWMRGNVVVQESVEPGKETKAIKYLLIRFLIKNCNLSVYGQRLVPFNDVVRFVLSVEDGDVFWSMKFHPVLHDVLVKFVEAADDVGSAVSSPLLQVSLQSFDLNSHVFRGEERESEVLPERVRDHGLLPIVLSSEVSSQTELSFDLAEQRFAVVKSGRNCGNNV